VKLNRTVVIYCRGIEAVAMEWPSVTSSGRYVWRCSRCGRKVKVAW
jgi:hypothetical protein